MDNLRRSIEKEINLILNTLKESKEVEQLIAKTQEILNNLNQGKFSTEDKELSGQVKHEPQDNMSLSEEIEKSAHENSD